jgi:predicted permease
MIALWQDLRLGARMLAKSPAFTAVAVIALALGLGVNAAVFSAVNTFLLRPLPVEDPERLVRVQARRHNQPLGWGGLSYGQYQAISVLDQIFSGVAASAVEGCAVSNGESRRSRGAVPAEVINGEVVSGNFLSVLGIRPVLGRGFSPDEGVNPGADPVVLISDGLWRRRYGANPAVVGRKIYFNQTAMTIIGVMPAAFKGAVFQSRIDFWVPLVLRARVAGGDNGFTTDRDVRVFSAFGRLRPGVTQAQATERLSVLAGELARQFPATDGALDLYAMPEIRGRYGRYYDSVRLSCALALVITCLVLVIGCANVVNLLLARATARTKEIGIRLALGAGRGRIVRQLLTESLLLAVIGGLLGVVLALWFADLMHAFVPPKTIRFELTFEPDARTIAWIVASALAAGLLCGVLPAARSAGADVLTALKTDVGAEGQRVRRLGLRQLLVVGQLAISIVVVVCGGLFVRSLRNLEKADPGFHYDTLVSATVDPTLVWDSELTEPNLERLYNELKQRLEARPGVVSVSSARNMPLNYWDLDGPVVKDGDPPPPANQGLMVPFSMVDTKYFETMGTDLLAGRDFLPAEHQGVASTAVINGQLARQLFGSERGALGRRFRMGGPQSPLLEVVGVAKDGRYLNLFEEPAPWVFLPNRSAASKAIDLTMRTILIRGASQQDLPSIAQSLRSEVGNLDARIPVDGLTVGDGHLSWVMYAPRIAAELGMILGLLALALATMGIYSLMTYTVSQRTKEIGIRIALGGRVRDVLRLVMGQALLLVALGVVVGVGGALAVTRLLNNFLFGVGTADLPTLAGTVVLLTVVAMLATLLPARRAAKVDPMVALRYE